MTWTATNLHALRTSYKNISNETHNPTDLATSHLARSIALDLETLATHLEQQIHLNALQSNPPTINWG